MDFFQTLLHAAVLALGMTWKTAWTLILGFTISSIIQSVVSTNAMRRALGEEGIKQISLATAMGAASSSCSYASAAIMRTLFKKGAALVNALAFMFASTNLVIELGIILFILMGWQFMVGEWIGGLVLIALMATIVKFTYPKKLAEEARNHEEAGGGHEHSAMTVEGSTWLERLKQPEARIRIAQNFTMEFSMLWKDLAIGFVVGGILAAFVPDAFWKALFLTDASPWIQVPANAIVGPIVAIFTFVCSIGNVPLAAVLFAGGASFGGVLAFLYADLIVLPLLDAYRRYLGWKMAAYIGAVFFVTMVIAGLVMELVFAGLGLIPQHDTDVRQQLTQFSIDYTFWLNIVFGVLGAYLWWTSRKHPMNHQDHGDEETSDRDGAQKRSDPQSSGA